MARYSSAILQLCPTHKASMAGRTARHPQLQRRMVPGARVPKHQRRFKPRSIRHTTRAPLNRRIPSEGESTGSSGHNLQHSYQSHGSHESHVLYVLRPTQSSCHRNRDAASSNDKANHPTNTLTATGYATIESP